MRSSISLGRFVFPERGSRDFDLAVTGILVAEPDNSTLEQERDKSARLFHVSSEG